MFHGVSAAPPVAGEMGGAQIAPVVRPPRAGTAPLPARAHRRSGATFFSSRDDAVISSALRSGTPSERRSSFWRRTWAACSFVAAATLFVRSSTWACSSACQAASRAAARFAWSSSLWAS
jgi:hypothetical protein